MQQESIPKNNLLQKQTDLNSKKSVLSSLDSKLSSLNSVSERFTDPITDYFASKNAESSDSEKFTVSSTSTASAGNHSITVERLAKSDTRVSQQYNSSDTSFTGITSDQAFKIEIGHPTEDDEFNRISIDITVSADTFSKSNDKVLKEIADKINDKMFKSATEDSIENDEKVHASVVTESSGKSRLVFRTEKSGYNYRMKFTDSADGLLNQLEINSNKKSSNTLGGYIHEIGTGSTESMLNAKFTLDGLVFYRDKNSVSDAVSGLTINLQDTFDNAETITIKSDETAVKEEMNCFIKSYNEALKFLKSNTQMDPKTYKEGPLSRDLTYRNIYFGLRNIVSSSVSSVNNSSYSTLYHLGIEIQDDGSLKVEDSEKFNEALASDSKNVSDIFNSSEGLSVKIKDYLDSYIKTGGAIDSSKKNIDTNIVNINDRIGQMNDILAAKEIQLRDEFSQMQDMINKLNNQQNFLNSFASLY